MACLDLLLSMFYSVSNKAKEVLDPGPIVAVSCCFVVWRRFLVVAWRGLTVGWMKIQVGHVGLSRRLLGSGVQRGLWETMVVLCGVWI